MGEDTSNYAIDKGLISKFVTTTTKTTTQKPNPFKNEQKA